MVKQLIIITVADVLLLGLFVYSIHPDPSIALGAIVIIPIIFLINIFIGLILKALKNKWANAFLINSISASLIFNGLYNSAIAKQTASQYKTFYFTDENKDYELDLSLEKGKFKNDKGYAIFERANGSSTGTGLGGKYKIKNDTLLLIDDSSANKNMRVFRDTLYDYSENKKKITVFQDKY